MKNIQNKIKLLIKNNFLVGFSLGISLGIIIILIIQYKYWGIEPILGLFKIFNVMPSKKTDNEQMENKRPSESSEEIIYTNNKQEKDEVIYNESNIRAHYEYDPSFVDERTMWQKKADENQLEVERGHGDLPNRDLPTQTLEQKNIIDLEKLILENKIKELKKDNKIKKKTIKKLVEENNSLEEELEELYEEDRLKQEQLTLLDEGIHQMLEEQARLLQQQRRQNEETERLLREQLEEINRLNERQNF